MEMEICTAEKREREQQNKNEKETKAQVNVGYARSENLAQYTSRSPRAPLCRSARCFTLSQFGKTYMPPVSGASRSRRVLCADKRVETGQAHERVGEDAGVGLLTRRQRPR
jgi:hypothetical protein